MSTHEYSNIPRRIPALKLPLYRYQPGRDPHPFKDPNGHRYGADWKFPYHEDWRLDRGWLLGLDLFDHAYYWECHEILEHQWRERPRHCPSRQLLQGLIQSSAALLKPLGSAASKRLWNTAKRRLDVGSSCERGIDVRQTIISIDKALRGEGYPLVSGGWP